MCRGRADFCRHLLHTILALFAPTPRALVVITEAVLVVVVIAVVVVIVILRAYILVPVVVAVIVTLSTFPWPPGLIAHQTVVVVVVLKLFIWSQSPLREPRYAPMWR